MKLQVGKREKDPCAGISNYNDNQVNIWLEQRGEEIFVKSQQGPNGFAYTLFILTPNGEVLRSSGATGGGFATESVEDACDTYQAVAKTTPTHRY